MKDSGAKSHLRILRKTGLLFMPLEKAAKKAYCFRNCHTPKNPKLSIGIAGKGICFDTGGYNLKTGSGMDLMKKTWQELLRL